ncbi:hypothetical protein A374_10238 [Fictibacillus macauensis ZFHKF-1]|uniref:YugN-like family protein n=1 Tax=Fictibacillus macauensis ZFHKF-1 TaxID=1196324 RepID=I8AIP9_9BACL|nr:YugN-like family protein [Fictibacillus macauensis]EIT85607.1 hypothetical protein A374_10238 [Fictibacillus macauensis ZFHKF-1]
MIQLKSALQGECYPLGELEALLTEEGFVIGGNWDYDHGYFDYKLDDEVGYTFVRLPFTAHEKEVGENGAIVKLGEPFLLAHKYQIGLDDHANVGSVMGSFNQFSEPQDPDASIDPKWLDIGQALLTKIEQKLLNN